MSLTWFPVRMTKLSLSYVAVKNGHLPHATRGEVLYEFLYNKTGSEPAHNVEEERIVRNEPNRRDHASQQIPHSQASPSGMDEPSIGVRREFVVTSGWESYSFPIQPIAKVCDS